MIMVPITLLTEQVGNGSSNITVAQVNGFVDDNFKVNSGYNHAQSTHNNGNGDGNMNFKQTTLIQIYLQVVTFIPTQLFTIQDY